MTTFNDRERGFEGAFAHQEKLGFDLEAKISKLYGLWIAERLGLDGDAANIYAMDVVSANLEEPGFDDVLRKVKGDLDEKGVTISDEDLHENLEQAIAQARADATS